MQPSPLSPHPYDTAMRAQLKPVRSVPLILLVGMCLCLWRGSAQESRLSNLSVRAQGGGNDALITGFTIGPGGSKAVVVRAVGPTLVNFGVGNALADPKLELYSGATKVAENDNWNGTDAATFSSLGAFALGANSRDAAIVTTLTPGSYTAQVSGPGAAGVVLVEVYELNGATTRLINLSTRANVGTGANVLIPGITVSPGAGSRRLLIRAVGPTLSSFGVSGVLADPKLELYAGTVKLAENDDWEMPIGNAPASATALSTAATQAGAFSLGTRSKDAALLMNLGPGSYTLQVSGVANATGSALVEVYDITPLPPSTTLFSAQLRPDATAPGSTASGIVTVLLSEDGSVATVSLTFSNLSSPQTSGYLKLGNDQVFSLGVGQVSGRTWTFSPAGAYTSEQLVNALKNGQLTVEISSTRFPAGELGGRLIPTRGTQTFTAPPPPPALPLGALIRPSETDAARFLTQATFGPTVATIAALQQRGIEGWLDDQMAMPATSALAGLRADLAAFPNPPDPMPGAVPRFAFSGNWDAAWWKIAVTAPDQLRQRVAFALSEILVVGQQDDLTFNLECMARYYDILGQGAFSNYRELLENVTLNPAMGVWLSYRGNLKANPAKGTAPDENYAREIQQLFTIGLVQLQPDGTLLLDATGQPIPTYDQATVSETAKVFTGWSWAILPETNTNEGTFLGSKPDTSGYPAPLSDNSGWLIPMRNYEAFHDQTAKRIVSLQQVPLAEAEPTVLPAGQTGPQDLKATLDTLFHHPNTGPFLCRQLIQRLVTSNPSSAYVYRVAQVFADDGTGIRGNLRAVVRAILTDYEARSPDVLGSFGYGKIKEPVIRVAGFFRALKGAAPNGRYLDGWYGDPRAGGFNPVSKLFNPRFWLGQGAMFSPTVFNFFTPTYAPPGAMAAAGLVAPEMEIIDAGIAIRVPSTMANFMYRTNPPLPASAPTPSPFITLDYSALLPNIGSYPALLDQLNLLFCTNQMAAGTRAQILAALQQLKPSATELDRVQTAIQLVISSPDCALQK